MKANQRGRFGIIEIMGILFLLLASTGWVQAGTYGVLTYEIRGATVEITDCDQAATGSLVVPDEIEGKPVTIIGDYAFSWCYYLSEITIPAGIASIGEWAFRGCRILHSITVNVGNTYFESVDGVLFNEEQTLLIQYPGGKSGPYIIPAGTVAIKDWAFYNCESVTEITFPASIRILGDNVFWYCSSLTTIAVDTGNTYFESLEGVLFDKTLTRLIQYPGGKTGAYAIPVGVSVIKDGAFLSCDGLSMIQIPEGVTTIHNLSFYSCNSLTGITLPNSISSIGYAAFRYCENMDTISVGAGNPYYASSSGVLFNKALTELIQCPAGKSGAYNLPNGVVAINDYAFEWCRNLTEITLPDSLATLGRSAFSSCTGLTGIVIPDGIATIEGWAFYNCFNLASVTLPDTLISIGDSAFRYCNSLAIVFIPQAVGSIGNYAFDECGNLAKIIFKGDAPALDGPDVFADTQFGFTVYFYSESIGFTVPTWQGYPAQAVSNTEPVILWLNGFGYPIDTGIGGDMNGDGVELLTAYALGLNPKLDLSESLPRPEISPGTMELPFYAGAEGVEYIVETSVNLMSWSTSGVVLSAPDSESFRTASVNLDSPSRFLRLRFVGE